MNEVLLSNEVIVYLLSEVLLYLLLFIAFMITPLLIKRWDFDAFTSEQFALEKRSYLVMTIIMFVMVLKILLLPYFVYTIDRLSDLVPGAMCAAGIIKANTYGNPLLALKIIIIFLSGLWMRLNSLDLQAKEYPYTEYKSWFFIAIFILLSVEIGLDILYFTNIETSNPVTCCSVIFGQAGGNNDLPFGLDIPKLLILFYLLYFFVVFMTFMRISIGIFLASILFLYIAYYSVVYFYGTYIYALPTHKCPFCMLQSDYYFVGYLVWGLLLVGVFFSLDYAFGKAIFDKEFSISKKLSLSLLTLFVALCSLYVATYYLKNGVLL